MRQSLSKPTATGKVTVLEDLSCYSITLHVPKSLLVAARKLTCTHSERPKPHTSKVIFHCFASTSIFGERKAFSPRQICRLCLQLTTSLLTQCDSFPEKLTFIQNSLLLLYIDKKMKN